MPKPDQHTQQQHDDYWQAVTDVAERIVAELQDTETDEDRDEILHRLLHEKTDDHDYVIRDDLQVQTLQYSQHPCAALAITFPFAAFAAEAFEMDVSQKVKKLLGQDS